MLQNLVLDTTVECCNMSNKRASSPLEQWRNDKRTRKDTDHIKHLVDRSVVNQMKMIEQHVFNERQCRELKDKHDKVDNNCLSWHDFAVDMQQRVKRLAVILNRQQESIKSLKLNTKVQTVNASVQTDELAILPPLSLLSVKKPTECVVKSEQESNEDVSKLKQSKPSHPSAFIDLTGNDDDCDQPDTKFTSRNDVKEIKMEPPFKLDLNDCAKTSNSIGHKFETAYTGGLSSNANSTAPVGQPVHEAERSSTHNSHSSYAQSNKPSILYPSLPPTPLPPKVLPNGNLLPPFQPELKIRKSSEGLELSWAHPNASKHTEMECYEIYVYQQNPNNVNNSNRWKKIKSDPIKAMPLPMACTLSQYSSTSTYYFAVRGKDVHGRYGNFSAPCCSNSLD